MNFNLSSLTSLNPMSILSNAAESICDAVLPKQLEFVGDAVGLVADLETGNYVKCLEDAQDLFKDLPQQLAELTKNGKATAGSGTDEMCSTASRELEPTPPTHYRGSRPMEDRAAHGHSHEPVGAPVTRGAPPQKHATKIDNDETVAKTSHRTKTDKTSKSAKSETPGATEISHADSGKTKEAEGTKSTATANKSMEPDAFFKLSDKALMDAVRDGKLPDSVKNDPEQMRRLQVRMEDISQMNNLLTTMLNTMHEMNKAVIQNLRV